MRFHKIQLFDHDFLVDPDDALGLTQNEFYEPYESTLIHDAILSIPHSRKQAIDIGAHIGYYSVLLASYSAHVDAFEPNPLNYAFLQINAQPYKELIQPLPFLVTSQEIERKHDSDESPIYLTLSPVNSGDDTQFPFDTYDRPKVRVQDAVSLDTFFLEDETFDFIKLDIQGGELNALRGMNRIIRNSPNLKMAIEFFPDALRASGECPEELLYMLFGLGFKVFEIKEQDWRLEQVTSTEICVRDDLRRGYTNLWAERG